MNPPHRSVSSLIPVAFALAAVYAVVVGFVMRKKFLGPSTEALPDNPRKALALWRAAQVISFSCAMSIAIFGVGLKFLGSTWLVPGIFFGLSLGFLLLWRPSPLAVLNLRE
jgi:putative Mn2+ efflux pump MntP